jgi:hypothetical protein
MSSTNTTDTATTAAVTQQPQVPQDIGATDPTKFASELSDALQKAGDALHQNLVNAIDAALKDFQGSAGSSGSDGGGVQVGGVKLFDIAHSNETATATSGHDLFVFNSTSLQGEKIDGFTVGQDHLAVRGGVSHLSLAADADGKSTDVMVDAGTDHAHTLVTLDGVQTTDLSSVLPQSGHHGDYFHFA